MLKGKALKYGDTIGLIGPSGAIRKPDGLARAVEKVKELGFNVKLGESCGQVYGYLSGSDEVRARDVSRMFADDEVDAVVCLRGGYGTMRMLDMIDYEAIAAHPKLFLGYSDITALHAAIWKNCGLATLHGPMPDSCWIGESFDDFTRESLFRALMSDKPLGLIENPEGYPLTTIVGGKCEGTLVGGNLSLVDGLLGTPYELDVKGKVLFLEDVGERTYRLDHMLTHLRLAGKFDECAGVVLGDFTDCPVEYPDFGLTLEEIIRDVLVPAGKPVLAGFKAGHGRPKITLPLGVACRLDADRQTLEITESAADA